MKRIDKVGMMEVIDRQWLSSDELHKKATHIRTRLHKMLYNQDADRMLEHEHVSM